MCLERVPGTTEGIRKYRVIHKSLRDFRPLRYSGRDGQAEGEHVNRGRDTPSFCPILQVLDMSTLGDAADVNPVIKFLQHTLHMCGRNLITGFVSPSRNPDLCGTEAGMVTPKGSMSTEGETLQVSVLPYRFSICPLLVTR